MASVRQNRVAQEIIKNAKRHKPISKGEIVRRAGYTMAQSKAPKAILESKGVKDELEDMGFTVAGADKVVGRILYRGKKEETRIKAAQEVYKRHGAYAHEEGNKTLILMVTPESAQRYNLQIANGTPTSPGSADSSAGPA